MELGRSARTTKLASADWIYAGRDAIVSCIQFWIVIRQKGGKVSKIEALKTELDRMRQGQLDAAKRGDVVRENELHVLIEKRLGELEWLESL